MRSFFFFFKIRPCCIVFRAGWDRYADTKLLDKPTDNTFSSYFSSWYSSTFPGRDSRARTYACTHKTQSRRALGRSSSNRAEIRASPLDHFDPAYPPLQRRFAPVGLQGRQRFSGKTATNIELQGFVHMRAKPFSPVKIELS